jgi:hypothetical protein
VNTTCSVEQPPASGALVEAIMHRLLDGGATDLEVTTRPLWIIGHGPSGRRWQILWYQPRQAYYVSWWATEGVEPLGTFPDWEAAVACALRA